MDRRKSKEKNIGNFLKFKGGQNFVTWHIRTIFFLTYHKNNTVHIYLMCYCFNIFHPMYIIEVLLVKANIKYLIYSAIKRDKCFKGVAYTRDFITRYSDLVIFATVAQSVFIFHQLFLRFCRVLQ
jgi:hypothetical protein